MESPYEYYNNTLGVKILWLVSDIKGKKKKHPKSVSLIKYRSLSHRMNSKTCTEKQLRAGSWASDALVAFDSLCREWKDILTKAFPKPKKQAQKGYFAKHYEADRDAFDHFCRHRFGDNNERKLDPEVIELYTYNASVLNTVIEVKTNRKAYVKTLGGVKINIWESLSNDVNAFREVDHDLPTTAGSLRHKVNRYLKGGYDSIISKKYGKRNRAKVKEQYQLILLEELLKKHQNLNNQQIAQIYNTIAEHKHDKWELISSPTVANYRKKLGYYAHAGSQGISSFRNNKAMQVKRTRPSLPMLYWTMDGWDTELLYQKDTINKKGHKVTTYHNRLTTVMVLDPFNNYPVGYAIGTNESPALIKEALRNAINHTKQLFGLRYKPLQLQTDNYQIKNLTPLYLATTKNFTPARVKNSKTKVIEPYFNQFNKKHFQAKMLPNWSGFNVTAKKSNQPNADYLNKIRHQFPDELGCRMQIIQAIENERKEKIQAYMENWQKLPQEDRLNFQTNQFLRVYGETTGYTNKLTGNGITPTINGQTMFFDSFDSNFRKYQHIDWAIYFDPTDLSEVLAVNAKSRNGKLVEINDTIEFVLQEKYTQPMALYDRNEGDAEELQRVLEFNKQEEQMLTQRVADHSKVLQELYHENPQLDVLQKMLIVDSNGQHKDQKSTARLETAPKHKAKKVIDLDDYEIIDNVRNTY